MRGTRDCCIATIFRPRLPRRHFNFMAWLSPSIRREQPQALRLRPSLASHLAQLPSKPSKKMRSVQLTTTLVTLPPLTVPLPLVTVQVWIGAVGWVVTLTT